MLGRSSSVEKSNRLLTAGCEAARVGVSLARREVEDIGPTDLRAAEFSEVFIGERERGGGRIGLPLRRSVRTSIGSGTVPVVQDLLSR